MSIRRSTGLPERPRRSWLRDRRAMRDSRISVALVGVVLLMIAGSGPVAAQAGPRRPNILFIVAEDISPLLGTYGTSEVRTPNLDQLAREGVRYTRAFQAAGVCATARAAVITGMYPTSIGAQHMRTTGSSVSASGARTMPADVVPYSVVLPERVRAFPEYLRKAGYYASNNHKTDYQFVPPVTVWDDSGPTASYRNRSRGQPFFSVFNFFVTHESQVAQRTDRLRVDPARITVPPIYPDTPEVRQDIARLYTNIETMDDQVGELIAILKADGVYDSTVIVFYSDNGGSLPWMKREILDRGAHVPLIVRLSGGERAGETDGALVSGVDLAPTVLSLAGVPIPEYMQGQAFLGQARAATPRRYVFAARDRMDTEYDRVRMVRDERFQYLRNYMPEKPYYQDIQYRLMLPMMKSILAARDEGRLDAAQAAWFKTKPAEELYDIEQDPWELHNLAGDHEHGGKLVELRAALDEWTMAFGDMGATSEPEMVRRMWNGRNHPPITAMPDVMRDGNGVRLACATPGASIGYRMVRAGASPQPVTHVVQSWDAEVLTGRMKNGDIVVAPSPWNVYDGELISLDSGDTLYVNAMRIGYSPASIEFVEGEDQAR
jgi:N-sulfoglucosamine sulfohydrolase